MVTGGFCNLPDESTKFHLPWVCPSGRTGYSLPSVILCQYEQDGVSIRCHVLRASLLRGRKKIGTKYSYGVCVCVCTDWGGLGLGKISREEPTVSPGGFIGKG